MDTFKKFITGSQYQGSYNSALCCMDGYGLYTYPDGSEYRGYFTRGHFDGFGRLKLIANGTFLIQGLWSEGELQTIEEITFPDGLRYKGDFLEHRLSTVDWKYLTKKDRRYSTEINNCLEAVGPYSYLTGNRPARYITPGCHDTEEGIYNPRTKFLYNVQKPFPPHRFVTSKAEREWILKNTRRGLGFEQDKSKYLEDLEPSPEDAQKIISTNVESMKSVGDRVEGCPCSHFTSNKDYFAKLCSKNNAGPPSSVDVTSEASISLSSIQLEVKEEIKTDLVNMEKSQIFDSKSNESSLMDYRVSYLYSTLKYKI